MLSPKLEEALNQQINAELYSAYLYFSMATYLSSIDLAGCAHWMHAQTQEELLHASKMYEYVNERGGRVVLNAIKAPKTQWASPLEVFEDAYRHEQHVTSLINGLMELAISEKDHATQIFLQWFISEQVEEEASANGVVQRMKLAQASPGGLFMIDKELSTRPVPFVLATANKA
jgi:ferritin